MLEDEVPHWTEPAAAPKPKKTRIISIVLIAVVSTFAIAVVILLRINSPQLQMSLSLSDDGNHDEEHDLHPFQLHPQDHMYRQPTTLRQSWNVTSGFRRPDGVLKQLNLVNDAFPGPLLEARSGDRLIIDAYNGLEDEGLSIHWHGLSMRGSNDMDGAVGITQTPIAPGDTFTYEFMIDEDQHGAFWWHAHDGVQRADGLYGGLVVHQPAEKKVDPDKEVADEHLLMISDWYHRSGKDALEFYMHPGSFGNEPVPDSILLNGNGAFNCADAVPARPLDCEMKTITDLPTVRVRTGGKSILRILNVGVYAGINIEVPGHALTVFVVDGGNSIERATGRSIGALHPGERIDVVVQADQNWSAEGDEEFEIVLRLDDSGFKYPNPALTLEHRFPGQWVPLSQDLETPQTQEAIDHLDLTLLQAPTISIPQQADHTIVLYAITQKLSRLKNEPHGFINNTFWQPQTSPTGALISLNRSQWDKHQFVPHIPYNPSSPLWVDIVLNNLDEESHPFHLHGYDFYVLSAYSSTFNWGSYNPFEDVEKPGGEYDLEHAVKKDTVLVPRRGYAVLRVRADNRGIWMFHCHVLWHQASGMAMAIEVR
jgi:FtsP/CotA-like multicopper oxidase with cupredoxin domain